MATTPIPRFTLVAPSADGTCCPCSALSDPCTCAGLIPIVRCRTRSALAALVGFREIVTPSDPPIKYLVATLSGSSTAHSCHGNDSCTDTHASGADVWSESTGLLTRGITVYNVCSNGQSSSRSWVYDDAGCPSLCAFSYTCRPDGYFGAGTNICCGDGALHDGGWSLTLTQPASEQQALYRATNGLKWSDWALLTELPGCSALWELRSGTTDYDFAVREAEYQLEFPALTITEQVQEVDIFGRLVWITPPSVDPETGVHYPDVPSLITTTRQLTAQVEVRVDINRRPWNGGSPWMLYRTDTFGPMTITGGQTFEGVVPNDRGYETIITNVRYRVVG